MCKIRLKCLNEIILHNEQAASNMREENGGVHDGKNGSRA